MSNFFSRIKLFIANCQVRLERITHYFYRQFLETKSDKESEKRKERITTAIIFSVLLVCIVFEIVIVVVYFSLGNKYQGIYPLNFGTILLLFLVMYVATRKGYSYTTSRIFIFVFFACVFYTNLRWGASLPMTLLGYGLIVAMTSLLIDSRSGFVVALISSISIICIGLYENAHGILPEWKLDVVKKRDVFGYGIMIFLTALLSKISNREMEKSLKRAELSEKILAQERDNLEIIVEQRTKALRESERERIRELYRFAEFGKLSGGIFHDLLNPLTAVTLSVAKLNEENCDLNDSTQTISSLKTATKATKRMEQFMATIRKQIKSDDIQTEFSVNEEVEDAIELTKFRAENNKISVCLTANDSHKCYGNPLKFNQVMTNLIINAIDSFGKNLNDPRSRNINISIEEDSGIRCSVTDDGEGIPDDIQNKIFTPFFTTKEDGLGLGLSTTKDIIEEHFSGNISCISRHGVGTTFTFTIPNTRNEKRAEEKNRINYPIELEIPKAIAEK